MSTATVLLIAIPLMVILALAIAFTSARRRDTEGLGRLSRETVARDRAISVDLGEDSALTGREIERAAVLERTGGGTDLLVREAPAPPEPWSPPDPEVIAVTRRQFLNRSAVTLMVVGTSAFGLACIAFLWPKAQGGFGATVTLGTVADVEAAILEGTGTGAANFAFFREAQSYITHYPPEAVEAAAGVYDPSLMPGIEAGYIASWRTCPHLGCSVPACATSQWFECPCHGSKYTRVGEKTAFGPAPRGLDHFPVIIEGDQFSVDTGARKLGLPQGTDTTAQGAEGPFCTDAGGEH
jgi:cytochrome b6-f complex iron-sulfur subunit